ncbi:MAG: Aspartokinase / Homoserine dehydrogenase [Ktedonobacterales bacterium]|jgi:aspartate kinase|nr:MAG: Aspartokinase / Homoserine dehydrogenase [Ktedonobacterales bacterium]
MRVIKFGGSSLANAERILASAQIVATASRTAPVTVVLSAMAGVTDTLISLAEHALARNTAWHDISDMLEARHRAIYTALADTPTETFVRQWDALLSDAEHLSALPQNTEPTTKAAAVARFSGWGERLIIDPFVWALTHLGTPTRGLLTAPVLLASVDDSLPIPSILATRAYLAPRLAPMVARGCVPVIPGYIAGDATGALTTLGRNGSDYSAAVIAAALGADSLVIYSDVSGIYTSDPNIVPEATLIHRLTYAEAAAIASRGAKVLHHSATEPLVRGRIPLYLRSSHLPDMPGTDIIPEPCGIRPSRWVIAAHPATNNTESDITITFLPSWSPNSVSPSPDLTSLLVRFPHAAICEQPSSDAIFPTIHFRVPAHQAAETQRAAHRTLTAFDCMAHEIMTPHQS